MIGLIAQDKSHERANMDGEKSEVEKPVELSDELTSDRWNIRRRCDDMVSYTPEEELHVDVTASTLQTPAVWFAHSDTQKYILSEKLMQIFNVTNIIFTH